MAAQSAAVILLAIALASTCYAAPERGSCVILGFRQYTPDVKSCSNCQWQSLTDPLSTGLIFDNVTYTKNQLATWNCGDGRWLNQSLAFPSPGLGVFFNATGAIIDTQEQGCFETAHQCLYWSDCTGFAYNFILVTKANGFNYCATIGAPNPFTRPGGRKLLMNVVDEDPEVAALFAEEMAKMIAT